MNSIIGHTSPYTPTALQQNFYSQQQPQTQQLNTTIAAPTNNVHMHSKVATSLTALNSHQQPQMQHNQLAAHLNGSNQKLDNSLITNPNNLMNRDNSYINTNDFAKGGSGSFIASAPSNSLCGNDNGNNCSFNKLINSF